jgi:hypothetical protein
LLRQLAACTKEVFLDRFLNPESGVDSRPLLNKLPRPSPPQTVAAHESPHDIQIEMFEKAYAQARQEYRSLAMQRVALQRRIDDLHANFKLAELIVKNDDNGRNSVSSSDLRQLAGGEEESSGASPNLLENR